ncbi:MAG: hypothetical protein EHM45_00380 [Desulfobacteraceae bacterium]|nr:MAG: hypothetical protein EHM45_00380 [Desulfobacteraceae bacterium]
MKDKIKYLIKIQEYDNRIENIIKAQKETPLKVQTLQETLNALETALQEDQTNLENIQKEKRVNERDTQDLDVKVAKSNEKLANIKSNKEYRAVLKEIDDLKHHKFQIEEVTLQILEKIETMENRISSNKEAFTKSKEQFKTDKTKIDVEMQALEKELRNLQQERLAVSQSTDAEFLKKYQFLRERRNGRGISAVVAGVCQTCHLGLPPQKFNELKKCDALVTCPHCNRIIYWAEDMFFQEAPQEPDPAPTAETQGDTLSQ